ncbi:hypothetical protein SBRCBS47491_002498 [Sporothrix bragantina]|uniref:D-xylulose reductase n=1 Tax=Sporothrix bragantina TaxID=671064 RepID=A0ABP0B7B2_9PEZI
MESTELPCTNHVCMMQAVGRLGWDKRPIPAEPEPYEVVIAPKKTGICGSDMHVFLSESAGKDASTKPIVLGHESAGIVTKVGSKVTTLKVGDRVAMEPGKYCLRCEFCKSGSYSQCQNVKFAAAEGIDGTLQAYYSLPADVCYKLPDSMSLEEGALIEPLAVAVMVIVSVAQMPHNANVAVFGAGPVGLLTMAVAKALGARRILAIDVQQQRLAFAKDYAATDIHVSVPRNAGEESIAYAQRHAQVISDKFCLDQPGRGIDLVIDCSGAPVCIQTGIFLAKRRGTYVQVGAGTPNVLVPMVTVLVKELRIKGSLRYGPGCYDMAIDLVHQGRIQLKPLITHRFPFSQADLAFKTTKDGVGPDGKLAIKTIIDGPLD